MTVAEKIKIYLVQNRISQREVAQKTGIPAPKLNLALNGNRKLGIDEFALILWATDTTADQFIEPVKVTQKSA